MNSAMLPGQKGRVYKERVGKERLVKERVVKGRVVKERGLFIFHISAHVRNSITLCIIIRIGNVYCSFAEFYFTECHFAECHFAKCQFADSSFN